MSATTYTNASAPHDRLAALPNPELVGDNGRGVEAVVDHLDAAHDAAEVKRRFDYVVSRLTRSQHELFILMDAGLTREQIAAELGITASTLSTRENRLMKKVKNVLRKRQTAPLISRL